MRISLIIVDTSPENIADVREREKIAREIEKTSESIRKKHRALKIDKIEEDMVLDRHFKPIIKCSAANC